MGDQGFNEVDLRLMMDAATEFSADHEAGRFAVGTRHEGRDRIVIVEPLADEQILIVVTAYPVG